MTFALHISASPWGAKQLPLKKRPAEPAWPLKDSIIILSKQWPNLLDSIIDFVLDAFTLSHLISTILHCISPFITNSIYWYLFQNEGCITESLPCNQVQEKIRPSRSQGQPVFLEDKRWQNRPVFRFVFGAGWNPLRFLSISKSVMPLSLPVADLNNDTTTDK